MSDSGLGLGLAGTRGEGFMISGVGFMISGVGFRIGEGLVDQV